MHHPPDPQLDAQHIESYHRQLSKVTKVKSIFSDGRGTAEDAVPSHDGCHPQMDRHLGIILLLLPVFFPERISSYLRQKRKILLGGLLKMSLHKIFYALLKRLHDSVPSSNPESFKYYVGLLSQQLLLRRVIRAGIQQLKIATEDRDIDQAFLFMQRSLDILSGRAWIAENLDHYRKQPWIILKNWKLGHKIMT